MTAVFGFILQMIESDYDLMQVCVKCSDLFLFQESTASHIDYQSMVKNIIDDFTSPTQIATEDTPEASNDAYINGLLLLFCKSLFHL